MYIPEIILTILIICLGLYLHHRENVHREEINKLKEEHSIETREAHLKSYEREEISVERIKSEYEEQIAKLTNAIDKLKKGTLVDELNEEIRQLKETILSLEDKVNDLIFDS